MCCRYYIEETNEMQAIVSDMMRSSLVRKWNELYPIKTYGEMSPTDIVPVIASNRNRQRAVFPMKWGFTGKTLLMNARVETAATKPTFKDAWKSHRCIVPASYYFEWGHPIKLNPADGRISESKNRNRKSRKTKYAIQSENELITYLAGLYRLENGYPHFAVLTREPDEEIRFIHNRMPVILKADQINTWINPQSTIEEINHIILQ